MDNLWKTRGACRGMDPELFFISENKTALAICKGCPVRRTCLEDALETGDGFIRGGTTEADRKIMLLFRRALTPISSSISALRNTVQTGFSQTVQVSVSISHTSKPQQSPASPIPSFELDLSECLEHYTQDSVKTSSPQGTVSFLPSPQISLNLAASSGS